MRFKAIHIIWYRDMKGYSKRGLRIFGSLIDPMVYLFGLGLGLSLVFKQVGIQNYLNFLAPGIIAQAILISAIYTGNDTLMDKQFGYLKEMLVAPVSRIEIMLGKSLFGATIAFLKGLFIFGIALLFGFQIQLSLLPIALIFMALIAIVFSAIGVAMGVILDDVYEFGVITGIIINLLTFLSGTFIPLSIIPEIIKLPTLINPLTYAVDGIRGSLGGGFYFNPINDILIFTVVAIISITIGTFIFSKIQS